MKNLFTIRYFRPEADHLECIDTVVVGFENALKIHKRNLGVNPCFVQMPAIYTAVVRDDGVITADKAVKELVNSWLDAEAMYAQAEANAYYFDDPIDWDVEVKAVESAREMLRAAGIEPPKYETIKGDAYYRELLGC